MSFCNETSEGNPMSPCYWNEYQRITDIKAFPMSGEENTGDILIINAFE